MSNLIGQTLLNQFRIDAFIASGGMGAVYRVTDLKRNAPLAMKVLHADLADDPGVFKRFQREARALQQLKHPNIVPFYGMFQEKGFACLLEAYIEGASLQEILGEQNGQVLPLKETLAYMKGLCAALHYAHLNNVVHCDVKPGNVLVNRRGKIFLADFGIARFVGATTTTTMGVAGTPAYMAPEQILGRGITPLTDIYALGVLLFEMLTGQRPFRGTEPETEAGGATPGDRIRYGHLRVPPPDPRQINANLSQALAQVVLRALAKNPAERFQSAQELFVALCRAAQRLPEQVSDETTVIGQLPPSVVAPPPSDYPRTSNKQRSAQSIVRRRQKTVLVFVAGAVVLLLLLSIAILGGRTLLQIPLLTPPVSNTVTPSLVIPITRLGKGEAQQVLWSPDGNKLAVISSIGVYIYDAQTEKEISFFEDTYAFNGSQPPLFNRDWSWLAEGGWSDRGVVIWEVGSGKRMRTLGKCSEQMAVSSDGKVLALGCTDIELWDVNSGQLLNTLTGLDSNDSITKLVFSQDGKILTAAIFGAGMRVWNVDSGQLLQILDKEDDDDFGQITRDDFTFSPDGRAIALMDYTWFETGSGSFNGVDFKGIQLWDLQSGARLKLLDNFRDCGGKISFSLDGRKLAVNCGSSGFLIGDLSSGQILHDIKGPMSSISDLVFSPSGQRLISVSDDTTMRMWDVASGQLVYTRPKAGSLFAFHPARDWLASSPIDRSPVPDVDSDSVKIWEINSGQVLRTINGFTNGIYRVAFHTNGQILASAEEGGIRIWDISHQKILHKLQIREYGDRFSIPHALCWEGDDLLSVWSDDIVRRYAISGELLKEFHLADKTRWGYAVFSEDCKYLASTIDDKTGPFVQDAANGKVLYTLQYPGAIFGPNGSLLTSGAQKGTAQLWTMQTGEIIRTFYFGDDWSPSQPQAFSPDGKLLATHGYVWDVTNGNRLYPFSGFKYPESVTFDPSGHWIVSGSQNGEIMIANAKDGDLIYQVVDNISAGLTLSGYADLANVHKDHVHSFSFSASGRTMASGSADGTIRLWQIYPYDGMPTPKPSVPLSIDIPTPTSISPPSSPLVHGQDDKMVLIPAGIFQMGQKPQFEDAMFVHAVNLDEFRIDVHEVTNASYARCVKAGICQPPGQNDSYTRPTYYDNPAYADYPVIYVDWNAAQTYCQWRGARLPTEAEWEKSARGGLDGQKYPWGSDEPVCKAGVSNGAQSAFCQLADTTAVGRFLPNSYGLYDMSGNVLEWVADWYDSGYYALSPSQNPAGPKSGNYRTLRGGSWFSYQYDLEAARRQYASPEFRSYDIGFRCARSAASP